MAQHCCGDHSTCKFDCVCECHRGWGSREHPYGGEKRGSQLTLDEKVSAIRNMMYAFLVSLICDNFLDPEQFPEDRLNRLKNGEEKYPNQIRMINDNFGGSWSRLVGASYKDYDEVASRVLKINPEQAEMAWRA